MILVGSNVHLGTLAHNRYEWIVAGKEVKNGENKVLLKDFNSTLYDDGWHGIAVRGGIVIASYRSIPGSEAFRAQFDLTIGRDLKVDTIKAHQETSITFKENSPGTRR